METRWQVYCEKETGNAYIVVIQKDRAQGVFEYAGIREAEDAAATLKEDPRVWRTWGNDVIDRLNDDGGIYIESDGITIEANAKNMHMVLSMYEEMVSEGKCEKEDPDIMDMMRCGGVK